MESNKAAAIYARVSTEEQATEGYSIPAQISELEKYADLHGIEIVARYIDEGVSGKSIQGRPQMKKLLRDAGNQTFDYVLVFKLDRLARKLKDSLDIIETLEKNNVKLISLHENFDVSTPIGRTVFQMISSISELERNTIVTRVKMGMAERAKQGKYNGGRILGYDAVNKELVVNEEEAHIVRIIFNYAEQGMGLKAITRRINEMGYRTKNHNPFNVLGVKNILNNPIYIGKIRFNQLENWSEKRRKGKNPDYILADGTHQPIISHEQWENVQRLMKKRSYKPTRSHTPFILAGLLRCPACGHGMVAGRSKGATGQTYRYYNCGQHHNKGKTVCSPHGIRADVAEQQVFDELSRIVTDDYLLEKLVKKINSDRMNAEKPLLEQKKLIEGKLAKTQKKLDNLKEKIMTDTDLLEMFKPNLIALQDELKTLHQQRERLVDQLDNQETEPVDFHALKKLLSDFHNVLMSVDPDEQKSLLRLIIKDIQITKESPRKIGRRVTQINLLFDFTIEALQSRSYELLQKVYHNYDYITDFDPSVLDGVTYSNFNKTGIGEVMNSLNILPLAMIRFPPPNPKRPINLLHQHQPHQLMRKRHLRKRQLHIPPLQHLSRQPQRPANDKRHLAAPVQSQLVQLAGQLLRRPHLPVDGERDHVMIRLDLGQDALALFALDLLHFACTQLFRRFLVADLHDLQLAICRQALGVLRDPFPQVFLLQLAHRYDRNLHALTFPSRATTQNQPALRTHGNACPAYRLQ